MITDMTTKTRSQIVLYSIFALLGLTTAFWFNSQAVLSNANYITDGFTSPVDWVYSLDLLIGGFAGMTFVVLESRKLGFKWWPLLVAGGFVTAFAFVFPLLHMYVNYLRMYYLMCYHHPNLLFLNKFHLNNMVMIPHNYFLERLCLLQ